MGRRGYPAEFRRKVLDSVASGRAVAEVATVLGLSEQTIYTWRRQDRIDRGPEAEEKNAESKRANGILQHRRTLDPERLPLMSGDSCCALNTPARPGARPSASAGHASG